MLHRWRSLGPNIPLLATVHMIIKAVNLQTLRRCYSRVKEHGIGKRKSSYTIEQLEKVFGQGGWDSQSCAPVLINSSGLYQEMESDSSTLEDFSQEDWCNQVLDSAFQEGDMETGERAARGRTAGDTQEESL